MLVLFLPFLFLKKMFDGYVLSHTRNHDSFSDASNYVCMSIHFNIRGDLEGILFILDLS